MFVWCLLEATTTTTTTTTTTKENKTRLGEKQPTNKKKTGNLLPEKRGNLSWIGKTGKQEEICDKSE